MWCKYITRSFLYAELKLDARQGMNFFWHHNILRIHINRKGVKSTKSSYELLSLPIHYSHSQSPHSFLVCTCNNGCS